MINSEIITKYVGIPFKDHGRSFDGCDCYGLVSLIYENELNIHLPQLGDLYSNAYHKKEVNKTVASVDRQSWCKTIPPNIQELKDYDVLVFRIGICDHHVGLYIGDGKMLHVIEGANAGIEKVNSFKWLRQFNRGLRYDNGEK